MSARSTTSVIMQSSSALWGRRPSAQPRGSSAAAALAQKINADGLGLYVDIPLGLLGPRPLDSNRPDLPHVVRRVYNEAAGGTP